ncbi:hypothetical protein [Flavobacterium sp. J27]|uniref:hypothetical protein n=1 Tax=Flavobacterium sp. J27 TaxID=2060419 RepID=UPI0010318928|nr:hypothetical protein [Flavobacterium sp. J27]
MITTTLLIVIVIAFGVYVYKFPPKKNPCPCGTPNKICLDYSNESMSELEVGLIHEMVDKYKENQLKTINQLSEFTNFGDARAIAFKLDTLKKFIYHIEKESLDRSVNLTDKITAKELGVRIYYAAYPPIDKWKNHDDLVPFLASNSIRNEYGHLHTLVMIPTRTKGTTTFDFNPLDSNTFSTGLYDRAGYAYNYTPANKTAALSLKSEDDNTNTTGSQNHGSLIPPGDPAGLMGF